ncbi:MAG: 30S ribosomal protein S4 [Planctomycetes bacterium]|nr:30S ribosomal protein S4 [Planctomycetota bacterium]
MARNIGPKARVNRRLSALIYESGGAARALEKRDSPPGMHMRPRRPSNYGLALREKQKIKHYYGLGERQLRRFFDVVSRQKGDTARTLLIQCERRLDNVIRRAGFAHTRPQARQGVVHGHFQVNGIKVTKPSYILRAGDVITVRRRENLLSYYRGLASDRQTTQLDWLSFDPETLRATMLGLPGPDDISLPVDANMVVEFLSR